MVAGPKRRMMIVSSFKPQLSEDAAKCKEPLTFPKLFSTKLDGIRCVTIDGQALSRSLKPIPNHYIREKLAPWQHLDGEIIVGPPNAEDVYRKTNSAVMSHEGEPDFVYYVFDDLQCVTDPFTSRLIRLKARTLPPFIQILQQFEVCSQETLDNTYQAVLDQGYEGLIGRNLDSLYKFGRATAKSQDSLKFKPFTDDDAQILWVYEAQTNSNEATIDELGRTHRSSHAINKSGNGMAGGFRVRMDGLEFDVAPGKLTHEERIIVWENQEKYVGRWLKFRHCPIGIKTAPRFPRFVGWRDIIDM